ncbi:MAG: hypothetical protein ACLQJ0_16195 [Steroidobacteraceae bacterium]
MGDNNQSIGPGMYFNTALYNFAQAAGSTPQSGDTAYGLASAMIGGAQNFCAAMCAAYGSKAGPIGQMHFRNALYNFDRAGRLYDPVRDTVEYRLSIVATAMQQFCAGTREALTPRP